MGARPPPQDNEEPDTTEFGIAALDAHLEDADLSYPIESDELIRALDDPEVPIDVNGHTAPLSRVVDRAGVERFDSEQAVLNELHSAFETERTETSHGVLGSIRSLVPF